MSTCKWLSVWLVWKKDMQEDRLKDLDTKKVKRPRKNQFGEFCQWQEMVGFSVILDNFYNLIVTKTEWSGCKRFLESLCFGLATDPSVSHITIIILQDHCRWNILFVDQSRHHIDDATPLFTSSSTGSNFDKYFRCFLHSLVLFHQHLFLFSLASY